MQKDLRYFIKYLEETHPGEFQRVRRTVDAHFELSAVMQKLQSENRFPALLFEDVKGSAMPVISGLWGNRAKMAAAFETTPDNLVASFLAACNNPIPPKSVSSAPVHEVVRTGADVDLEALPIVTHCERDLGAFICPGVLLSRNLDTGVINAGMYRHMQKGKNRLSVSYSPTSHGMHNFRKYEARNEPQDVVIALGHHPLLGITSQFSGSRDVCEIDVFGGALGEPVQMAPCKTVDLEVPAYCEIAIEGKVLPNLRETDAPFGEYAWYYGREIANPVMEVTAITYREDAIFHDLYNVGAEHVMLFAIGLEAIIDQHVGQVVSQYRAVHVPFSGVCFTAYVQIAKEIDGQGKNALLAALSSSPFIKIAIAVDEDIDIFNEAEVLWAVATRTRPDIDIFTVPEASGSRLDPMGYSLGGRLEYRGLNAKVGIDATKTIEVPFPDRAEPPRDLWRNINLEDFLPA